MQQFHGLPEKQKKKKKKNKQRWKKQGGDRSYKERVRAR